MQPEEMHSLLKRQLKKSFGDSFNVPKEWKGFIDLVNSAYRESDMDRNMLERSLDLSSQELLQANSEMRAIFEAVPDIFFRVNADGTILDCKTGNATDLFASRDCMIGKKIYDIPLNPVADKFRKALEHTTKTRSTVSFEYSLLLHGVENFCEARLIPLLEDQAIVIVRNITDRKDAELALKKSEEYYRELTMNSSDVVFIVDGQGNITYVSPSIERFTGYRPDEMIGKNSLCFIVPGDQVRAVESFKGALRTRDVSLSNSMRLLHKNGTELVMEGFGKNLLHNPAIGGFVMNIRDVTEHKRAVEELRESERKYKILAEKMSDIVWIADMNLRLVYISPSVEKVLGFSQEEQLARAADEQMTGASLALVMELLTGELALEKEGNADPERTVNLQLEYYHRDGSTRWLDMAVSGLRDARGTLTGFHGVSRDITTRKKAEEALRASEERYRTIFENTATANIIIAEDTTILMANNNYASLAGYTKNELEGKMSWVHFVHPDDLEKMKMYHRMRRIDPRLMPSSYEFRFINRRQEVKEFFINVAVIPETNESIASMVDLTESKQLETQLVQAQKMESVGRLAGGVAHDFNNMLSVIIGNAEMALRNADASSSLYKTLHDILNAGMRSADLTRQLLAFARKQTVNPRVLDLNDTISGMIKMLRRLIGEHIDLGWHPGHNLWKVKMDPSQVDQLLANLVVNARDAIEKTGRIAIEISNMTCDLAFCIDRPEWIPGDYVALAISDDGCGIGKESMANIFEPFFTTKKEGHGTGLGLATVYGIVKQNNGYINVYSEPGQGTTFRIYLPRHRDDAAVAGENADLPGEVPGGTETVLIVEDEPTVLKLSKAMLEALGYHVLAADGKDQALQLIEEYQGNIDLLFTDVVMPGMNGKDLSERIMTLKPGLKCLYMSGYTADVIGRQGVLREGLKFIAKPFSLQDLAVKVREALGA